jgi:D-galactarolactone cycloisomerase
MKISRIETTLVKIPHRHGGPPTGFGGRAWTTLDTLLVRVDTDAGVTGWGEAFGYNINEATRAAIDSLIAPLSLGRDATQIAEIGQDLQRTLHNFGRNGPVIYGLAGIDIALWDIAGKVAGLPLYRLLGGGPRSHITAYASLLRYSDPTLVAKITAEAVARGYRYVKLHETTTDAVKAAREAAGPEIRLMMDTNCPWTTIQAIEMTRRLKDCDLFWLEEPVWPPENYEGLAEVRRAGGIAIAAGENAGSVLDFKHMFMAGAVTYAQPSITKIGGVTEMRKVMTLAETFNVGVVPHAPYFGPGLVATLHVIAASPRESLFERLYCDLEASLVGGVIDAVDGRMTVPHAPGLGVEPDPAVMAKYRSG